MALNLENIEQQVAKNLESQAPTATTSVTLPKLDPQTEQSLRDEIAKLRREATAAKAESEDKESELRLKAAKAIAHKPVPAVRSNVQQEIGRASCRARG